MSQITPIPPLLVSDSEVSAFQVTRPNVTKGTVTQLISVATSVRLDSACGIITMFTSVLAADSSQSFTVNNTYVGTSSQLIVGVQDYSGTTGLPRVIVDNIVDGAFTVTLQNLGTVDDLNGIVKVSFLVI